MGDYISFRYSSSKNITFHGVIHTNITTEEWAEMSDKEKDYAIAEELSNLVDISVESE